MIGSDVPKQLLGRQVTVRPSTTCGHCAECRSGKDDNCVNRTGIGIGRDGAFTGMVAAPWGNCHLLPDDIDMDVAALTEPMTVCAEAVATAEIKAGDKILVLGPGFIGQGVAILARAAGAEVIVVGRDDAHRLGVLKELGFGHAIDTEQTGLDEVLRQHLPFDAIIEATGVPALINASLPYLKKRGIFVIVGIHPRAAEIDVTRLVRMHQQIRGSYRAPIAVWDEVIGFLAANQEMMKRLITHRFRLEDALLGFEAARNKSASKVILQVSTS
jgi:L-iditol 2-dehydrogenase/threonine 3-dehydrogenase